MRLIDADALIQYWLTPPMSVGWDDVIEDVNNQPTVDAIPKDQYENRLKADVVAMFKELKKEIEEIEMGNNVPFGFESVNKFYEGISASSKVIQQKINELKGEKR